MIDTRLVLPLTLLGTLALPASTHAQAPGYQAPGAGQLRAEYRAEVLGQVNEAMVDWEAAWRNDDVDALVALYVEDAVIFPAGGDPIRGREAIRAWLRETLTAHGPAQAFLQDFDASGGMSLSYSSYRIQVRGDGGIVDEVIGDLITIHLQQGRTWKIRSQVFRQH